MIGLDACSQLPEITTALDVFSKVDHLEREHVCYPREDALDHDDPHFLVRVDVGGVVAVVVPDRDAFVCDGRMKTRNTDHVAGEMRAASMSKQPLSSLAVVDSSRLSDDVVDVLIVAERQQLGRCVIVVWYVVVLFGFVWRRSWLQRHVSGGLCAGLE